MIVGNAAVRSADGICEQDVDFGRVEQDVLKLMKGEFTNSRVNLSFMEVQLQILCLSFCSQLSVMLEDAPGFVFYLEC